MARAVALLLLPFLFVSTFPIFGGSSEYYITPSDSDVNISCPVHSCLTLSQYANISDNHLASHSVLYLLPGIHVIEQPIVFRDIHNLSIQGLQNYVTHAHAVFHFPCHCFLEPVFNSKCYACAALQFRNVSDITIEGFSVTVKGTISSDTVGAMSFADAQNVNITNMATQFSLSNNYGCLFGIAMIISQCIRIYHSQIEGGMYGMISGGAQNVIVANVTFHNSDNDAIRIRNSSTVVMTALNIRATGRRGLHVSLSNTVCLQDSVITHSGLDGIRIKSTYNANVLRSKVLNSSLQYGFGIDIYDSHNFTINDMYIMNAKWEGIHIDGSDNFEIIDTHVIVHAGVTSLIHCRSFLVSNITLQNQKSYSGMYVYQSDHGVIRESTFTNFTLSLITSDFVRLSTAGVVLYNSSNISFTDCIFTQNNVTALKLVSSSIAFSGNLSFVHNRGYIGGAILLVQHSVITLEENAVVLFKENSALFAGGAIFIGYNQYFRLQYSNAYGPLVKRASCFLHVKGNITDARLRFENNGALIGGDVVYGGSLGLACKDRNVENGWICDSNCLLLLKLISLMQSDSSRSSLIASDPIGVCLCNISETPDCLKVIEDAPYSIYPGQTIYLSVAAVGQNFGTVVGSIFAQFLQGPGRIAQLDPSQQIQGTTKHCTKLNFTISSRSRYATLVLTSQFREVTQLPSNDTLQRVLRQYENFHANKQAFPEYLLQFPKYINVTLLDCPPGFEMTNNPPKCECHSRLKHLSSVTCNIQDQTIWRSGLVWIGPHSDDNTGGPVTDVVAAVHCPYNYCTPRHIGIHLTNSETQCNGNRSGTLCGRCQSGLSLTLGYGQCQKCTNDYLALLLPFALAGVVLVLVIKCLNLTVADGALNGIIFYVNIVKINETIFFPGRHPINPVTTFIAWLNLDWGIQSCFFTGYNAYWRTWLQYIFPLYVWIIAVFIIVIAKYSSRVASKMGQNTVPVLATLFLLSYAKLFRTIVTSLSFTLINTPNGRKAVWSADGNIDYFGPQHIPLFLTAVTVLLFLWLPYTILLALEQWLRKSNLRVVTRLLISLKPFLDAHCSSAKDKHRYWFGALLLVRAAIVLVAGVLPTDKSSGIIFTVGLATVLLMGYSFIGPGFYQNYCLSLLELSLFMNLALLCLSNFYVTSVGGSVIAATYTFVGVVFLQFLGLLLIRIMAKLKETKVADFVKNMYSCLGKINKEINDWDQDQELRRVPSYDWTDITYRECEES